MDRETPTRSPTRTRGPLVPFFWLGGALFSVLCCIGLAPLVGLVSVAGAGFLLSNAVLLPLLFFFLTVGGLAMWRSQRRHGNPFPLLFHVAGAALTLFFTWVVFHGLLIWVGLAVLIATVFWNVQLEYRYWHRDPGIVFSRAE